MTTFARMVLQPELSLAEAKKQFEHNYLQHHHYDRLVEDNLLGELREVSSNSNSGKPATTPKFLFLKNALPQKTVLELYPALSRLHFRKRNHSRLSVGLGKGGDTAMGWFEKPYPRLLAPTYRYPGPYFSHLIPLFDTLSRLIRASLPDYWQEQATAAGRNPNMVMGDPFRPGSALLRKATAPSSSVTASPIFSTCAINRNVIFRCHADGHNSSALACVMAFGCFSGGYLCLPMLRVAFNLSPGDVLLADNNEEQHGNIGPLVGDRISLVCYLRDLSEKKDPRAATGTALSHRRGH